MTGKRIMRILYVLSRVHYEEMEKAGKGRRPFVLRVLRR
jgi:hypothetical protein